MWSSIVSTNIGTGKNAFSINLLSLTNEVSAVDTYAKILKSFASDVSRIETQEFQGSSIKVNDVLKKLSEEIQVESDYLGKFSKDLERCLLKYETTETNLCSKLTF